MKVSYVSTRFGVRTYLLAMDQLSYYISVPFRAYFTRNHNVHACWYSASHSFGKTAAILAMRHARKCCWMAAGKLLLIQKPFVLPVTKCDLVILQNIHFSAKRTDRTMMDFRINMITFEGLMRKFGHTTAPEWIILSISFSVF